MKSSKFSEFKALFQLTRPLNLFFVVLTQILCSFYILKSDISIHLGLLYFGTFLITAAGYVINDYFDIKADAINKPRQVYIGRIVSRRKSLLFVLLLNASALTLSFFINFQITLSYFVIIVLLWLYSYLLKRSFLIGNILVAGLAAYSIYILDFLQHGSYAPITNNLLIAFIFFAFITNLIREVIKDCEDIKGDLLLKSKTLPIVIGIQNTRILILILNLIFLSAIWYCAIQYGKQILFIPSVIISALIIWTTINIFVFKIPSGFKKASLLLKIIMLIGCLSILIL